MPLKYLLRKLKWTMCWLKVVRLPTVCTSRYYKIKKRGNWRWEVLEEKFDFTRDWEREAQEAGVAIICWQFREEGWKILWQSWKRSLHWIYDEGEPFLERSKRKKETNVWPCFISWRPRKRQKSSLRAVWIMFAIIELVGFSSDWLHRGSYFSAYCASKWHTSQ